MVALIVAAILNDIKTQDTIFAPIDLHVQGKTSEYKTNLVLGIDAEPIGEDAFDVGWLGRWNGSTSVDISLVSLLLQSEEGNFCVPRFQVIEKRFAESQGITTDESHPLPTAATSLWFLGENVCLTPENATPASWIAPRQTSHTFYTSSSEQDERDFHHKVQSSSMLSYEQNKIGAFPFDDIEASVIIVLEAYDLMGQPVYPQQDVRLIVGADYWVVDANLEPVLVPERMLFEHTEEQMDAITVNLSLRRPTYFKVMAIVLPLVLLAVIIGLLFTQELGGALEVSLGIVLGLWSTQEILLPDFVSGFTLIHLIIVILYLIFAWAIFIRFLWLPGFKYLKQTSGVPKDLSNQIQPETNISIALTDSDEIHGNSDKVNGDSKDTSSSQKKIVIALFSIFSITTMFVQWLKLRREQRQ